MGLKRRAEEARKKRDKYQEIRIELRRIWDKPVEIVPIIIRALGTLPKSLKRNLEELGADVSPGLLQKSVVLETAHIIRSDGLLRRQDAARRSQTIKNQLVIAVMEQKKK